MDLVDLILTSVFFFFFPNWDFRYFFLEMSEKKDAEMGEQNLASKPLRHARLLPSPHPFRGGVRDPRWSLSLLHEKHSPPAARGATWG